MLDALTLASSPADRPVAMFVDRSDDGPGQEARRGRGGADHRRGAPEVSMVALDVGYVPLLDAAPLVIAREIGFAAARRISA